MLEVMIRIVFLKSTVRPCESVIRPLKRYLQNYVETLTAKKILSGDVHAGDTIVLDVKDGAFTVSTK